MDKQLNKQLNNYKSLSTKGNKNSKGVKHNG